MKQSSDRASWSPVFYLLMAGLLALASIYASKLTHMTFSVSFFVGRINLRWVFWLTTILASVSLLRLILLVMGELHENRFLPKTLDVFYQEEFRSSIARLAFVLRRKIGSLGALLIAAGLGILLFIAFVSNTYIVRARDVNSYLNEYALGILGRSGARLESPAVLELQLLMASHDVSEYIRNCETIVRDLENVGARAVLIDIRAVSGGKPEADRKLLDPLTKSGIVVFGGSSFSMLPRNSSPRGIYTLRASEISTNPFVARIQPAGDLLRDPGAGDAYGDVTLELLRKYGRYASDLKPTMEGSSVSFGEFRIPVSSDGWMYSRDRWGDVAFWPRVYVTQGFGSDTLRYQSMRNGLTFGKDLQNVREEFKDKIFLIGWTTSSTFESFMFNKIYAAAIQNIVYNSVIRNVEMSPLWLSAICLVISIFIAARFRPLVAILFMFVFGIVVLFADSILLDRTNVLVEIIYPLLAILLSLMIFPAVSFVHRLENREPQNRVSSFS